MISLMPLILVPLLDYGNASMKPACGCGQYNGCGSGCGGANGCGCGSLNGGGEGDCGGAGELG